MNHRKDPARQLPGGRANGRDEPAPASETIDWEARALDQIRLHVRELAKPGSVQAGWETDTITRLEDYFDHEEV